MFSIRGSVPAALLYRAVVLVGGQQRTIQSKILLFKWLVLVKVSLIANQSRGLSDGETAEQLSFACNWN